MEAGAGIECDVRLSSDGGVVVFHDPDLRRMCNIALEVERTPAALLTGQRLSGSNQYIPALWQLLELVGGQVPLLLELKTRNGNAVHLCSEVVADLAPRDGPVGVMSFDPQVARWLKTNAPHIQRGLVIADRLAPVRRWFSMWIADPQFLAIDSKAIRKPWVARSRRHRPVYTWTVRTPADRETARVHADAAIWETDGRP